MYEEMVVCQKRKKADGGWTDVVLHHQSDSQLIGLGFRGSYLHPASLHPCNFKRRHFGRQDFLRRKHLGLNCFFWTFAFHLRCSLKTSRILSVIKVSNPIPIPLSLTHPIVACKSVTRIYAS